MTWSQPALWNGPDPSALPQTRPMARRSDPDTSRDASVIALFDAPNLRERCLEAFRARGPMTDHELAAAVGRQQTSVGVRRKELERVGLVELVYGVDGKPARRLTPSGATAQVWRAVS